MKHSRNASAPPESVSPAPLHNQPANGANNNGLVTSDLTTLPIVATSFFSIYRPSSINTIATANRTHTVMIMPITAGATLA